MTEGGAFTPVAGTKKGKDRENLKKALVFQLLLAVIVHKNYNSGTTLIDLKFKFSTIT